MDHQLPVYNYSSLNILAHESNGKVTENPASHIQTRTHQDRAISLSFDSRMDFCFTTLDLLDTRRLIDAKFPTVTKFSSLQE